MNIIDRVRAKREGLARTFKEYPGLRRSVEGNYPDKVHFLFELLQNAEDTGASEAMFQLTKGSLIFEHNGRSFTVKDLEAITNIGEGTKSEDNDSIGQFGIGFKAVFAYSETPHVYSPTLSFSISDFVLPSSIPRIADLGDRTRFVFKFNNAKKSPKLAYEEIKEKLEKLPSTTILFLRNLKKIEWSVDGREAEITQNRHSNNHVEVLKSKGEIKKSSSHYLIFSELVKGYDKHHMAVAYELDFLSQAESTTYLGDVALNKQMKLTPASPGQVAIFFPAENETSGLRFHLHAPFVATLDRSSMKDTEANNPLFLQLSSVVKNSLYVIKNLGLLANDFLAILPNSGDQIPDKYQPILDAVITEMKANPLTPNYYKGHSPANNLIQAKPSLKTLLLSDDLKYLNPTGDGRNVWAIGVNQRNSRIDLFLSDLDIVERNTGYIYEIFSKRLSFTHDDYDHDTRSFYDWLDRKDDAWFQLLYSTLEKNDAEGMNFPVAKHYLEHARFLRLKNGVYGAAFECFFPDDDNCNEEDLLFPRVSLGTITSGENAQEKELARQFLERLGVCEVGEQQQIEHILKKRYSHAVEVPNEDVYIADLKRFINFINESSGDATIFSLCYIFQGQDGVLRQPCEIYIDKPYLDSGLSSAFSLLEDGKSPLSLTYEDYQIEMDSIVSFAKKLSVQFELNFVSTSIFDNPAVAYLSKVGGAAATNLGINRDFDIEGLVQLCKASSEEISKLIWKTLNSKNPIIFVGRLDNQLSIKAVYSKNANGGQRQADAMFIHTLRSEAWVPQGGGRFVKPSEAFSKLLPEGFAFDAGLAWIKAVNFGEDVRKDTEEQAQQDEWAKEALGTAKKEELARAKMFLELPEDEQELALERYKNKQLPDRESANPSRRAERVEAQALEAQEKVGEVRERTIQVGTADVKKLAESYLLGLYTNNDDEMICQICRKKLPFKVSDGSYYFEKVEFLKGLDRRHRQNYLALCPNHAAMFKHANGSLKKLNPDFGGIMGNDLEVELAGIQRSIYFNKVHAADIKAVLSAESAPN